MKTKNLFPLPALTASLGLILVARTPAQTFATLYSFTAASGGSYPNVTNKDGADPFAVLVLSGNTLYGTANYGGVSGYGTVFKVSIDGTGFTNLHSFTGGNDGAYSQGGLVLSGNTLYGTTYAFGTPSKGTVFAINTDGTGFTNLHSFAGSSDGANPGGGLVLSGDTLYGTAAQGGVLGHGTVFAINTNGTGFTNLHNFAGSDGDGPASTLVLSGNTLYGAAAGGGTLDYGTVFAISTSGTGFTNLHSFTGGFTGHYGGIDGAYPGNLILSGSTLYGATLSGGSLGSGMLFAISTNGTFITNLHNFNYGSDGGRLYGGLVLSGKYLYGTAFNGGSNGVGTVFVVSTNGAGFTNLHSFTGASDGSGPRAGLILAGNILYGAASQGGASGEGTVFGLSLPSSLWRVDLFVPGNSDPWLAGMPNGSVSGWDQAYDTAPAESPVLVSNLVFTSGSVLTFFASGMEANGGPPLYGGAGALFGADGNVTNNTSRYPGAENGIADIHVPMDALVGVFLDDSVPSNSPAPASLDFSIATARNFTSLKPALRQPFFIGDGSTAQGITQQFVAPQGATRLFLGPMDAYGWADNSGGFMVTVTVSPQLMLIHSGTNVIVTWPADYVGFTLQSTTNLVSPMVWSTDSSASVVVNGQNAVTNPFVGPQKFFRLAR